MTFLLILGAFLDEGDEQLQISPSEILLLELDYHEEIHSMVSISDK